MNLPEFIRLAGAPPSLDFLVIGGYAVGVHGYARATFDVDFLVRRRDMDIWKRRLLDAGLEIVAERSAFAQFTQPSGEGIDLMLVEDATLDPLMRSSVRSEFDGTPAAVIGLDGLLMLKLHVLRQEIPNRTGKDAGDVEMLLRRNRVPLDADHYRQLFVIYGSQELYDTFRRILRGG